MGQYLYKLATSLFMGYVFSCDAAILKLRMKGGVSMTNYYYLASDHEIRFAEGQLNAWPADPETEKDVIGFDFPIQFEMLSPEKEKEAFPLYLCIHYHFERFPKATFQLANYLSSNIEECTIDQKKSLSIRNLSSPKQLLLHAGELLTIHTKGNAPQNGLWIN